MDVASEWQGCCSLVSLTTKEGDLVDKLKGITPKGPEMVAPKYVANAKPIGSEPIVQNVVPETAAFQKEPQQCDAYKSMVSPLKANK